MNKKTRRLTLSSIFSALTVVMLYIASVWPTGQLGLAALASLFIAAAVIESGLVYGFYVYLISSALGMLIIPNRAPGIIFIIFFGYYPILKYLIERIGHYRIPDLAVPGDTEFIPKNSARSERKVFYTVIQLALKLVVFNIALTLALFFLKELIFEAEEILPGKIVLYIGGNLVFILFDYGFSKVIDYYKNRVSGYRRKG